MACIYYFRQADGSEVRIEGDEAAVRYIRENKLYENSNKKGSPDRTTEHLAAVLRQAAFGENNFTPQELRAFQEELLTEFTKLESQADYYYKIGPIIALVKGLGKGWETIDGIKRSLQELGVGAELKNEVPFDVTYLLTGDPQYLLVNSPNTYFHNISANNIRIMKEIDALSKTMFVERTPSYQNILDKTLANMDSPLYKDKVEEMRDELTAFTQIAAYKQWLRFNGTYRDTLRNSLIYDTLGNTPSIVDIANEAIKLSPNNDFLKFILPVSTLVKVGKKQQKRYLDRDLINTIVGKTRGKIEPNLISDLMDSFLELYNGFGTDPDTNRQISTKYHARALFDYLIVKDGLMFKNNSFIKMLPTLMFDDMSNAAKNATRLMSATTMTEYRRILNDLRTITAEDSVTGQTKTFFTREESLRIRDIIQNYTTADTDGSEEGRNLALKNMKNALFSKIFGYDNHSFYNRFERIYASDVRHQFNLNLIKLSVRTATGQIKKVSAINIADEADGRYIRVDLGTGLAGLPAEEYTKRLAENLAQLQDAGFPYSEHSISDVENPINNRHYLVFKKFVRVLEQSARTDIETGFASKAVYKTYELVSVERDRTHYSGAGLTAEDELVPRGRAATYRAIEPVGSSNSVGVADLGTRPTRQELTAILEEKIRRDRGDRGGEDAANYVDPPVPPTPGTDGSTMSDESGSAVTHRNDESASGNPFGDEASATPISGTSFGKKQEALKPANTDDKINNANEQLIKDFFDAGKAKKAGFEYLDIPKGLNNKQVEEILDKVFQQNNKQDKDKYLKQLTTYADYQKVQDLLKSGYDDTAIGLGDSHGELSMKSLKEFIFENMTSVGNDSFSLGGNTKGLAGLLADYNKGEYNDEPEMKEQVKKILERYNLLLTESNNPNQLGLFGNQQSSATGSASSVKAQDDFVDPFGLQPYNPDTDNGPIPNISKKDLDDNPC
jgi:hypothetical protein